MGVLRAALTLRSSPPPEDCRLVVLEPQAPMGGSGGWGEHIGLSPVSSPTVTCRDGLLEEVEGIFLQLIVSLSKPV